MTIDLTDNAPRVSYTVSTSTTSFAVPFEFFDDADLVVVVGGTTKTLTTHYTVSGGNGATGTVTMTSGNAVSSGTVIIFRDIDFKRTTDFPTSGAFPIATLNTELDRNIALFDDLQDRIDRSVRLTDNDDAATMTIPLKASRLGKILGFHATTGAVEAVGDSSTITTIQNAIGDNTLTLTGVITGGTITTAGTVNFGSLADGSITITAFVDEDDMSSNSATLVPTQQSVKAYVDSQVTAQDLDATTDSGTIAIDLDSETLTIAGGEGIDTSATGNTITIAGEDASTSNKGVASFASADFDVSSGAVSIKSGGVSNDQLAGSIADSKLSTITTADKVSGAAVQIDGATDGTSITVADSDKLLIDDGGTTKYINASQLNSYISAEALAMAADNLSAGDAAVTLTTTSGNITIDAQASDSNIILKGTDGSTDTTFLTISGADAGAATFNSDVKSANGNFVTTGSNIALKHSSGENFFTATKDGGSAMYHDSYPVFSTSGQNKGAVGTTNGNTFSLDTQSTFLEIGNSGIAGGTDTGTVVLSATSNANDERIGDIRFANAANADDDGTDADGRMVARIQTKSVTSDSNAGDDSGGTIVFSTKPEAGSIATALTLGSDQSATFGGNVDVTGTVTADGLTVAQSSGANILLESTTSGATEGDIFGEIEFKTNDSNSSGIKGKIDSRSEGSVGNGALRLFTGDTTGLYQRINIASNGDISFYEDTGTTPKFVWDSSSEVLRIGSIGTGIARPLMIKSDTNHHAIHIEENSGTEGYTIGVNADGDLGFYNSATSTPSVVINDSNNFGIGDASPSNRLSVVAADGDADNAYVATFQNQEATDDRNFGVLIKAGSTSTDSALVVTDHDASNNLFFVKGNGNAFIGGNVGIGITSPSSYNSGSDNLVVGGTSGDNGITIATGTTNGGLLAFADGTSGNAAYRGYIQYDHNTDFLAVGSAGSERMRIDSSGNVGIGVTSPSAGLHIDNPNDSQITAILDTDNSAVKMVFRNNTETGNNVQIGADGSNLVALTNASERMRIDSSGNVGIGRTDPSFELDINGELRIASANSSLYLEEAASDAFGSHLVFRKTRNTTVGSHTVVQDGDTLGTIVFQGSDGSGMENAATIACEVDGTPFSSSDTTDMPGRLIFKTSPDGSATPTERMRIDSSGNLLVGTTASTAYNNSSDVYGFNVYANGQIASSVNGVQAAYFNRQNSHGQLLDFRKDGSNIGTIGSTASGMEIFASGVNNCGWRFNDNSAILPMKNSDTSDNLVDLGNSSFRMDDIFATNGTIQTSDENEKQDIASMTIAELAVGKRLSTLFKTFRWKDKVTEKADKARTHSGIVAQEVKAAFEAEGLDATKYALFCSDTWTNDDGKEQTRMGVRYPELLSFIASYNESRFTAIEARLTALEGV